MKQPIVLADVPAYLVGVRPDQHATVAEWAEFHERSAEVYAQVAITDDVCGQAAAILARLESDQAETYRRSHATRHSGQS